MNKHIHIFFFAGLVLFTSTLVKSQEDFPAFFDIDYSFFRYYANEVTPPDADWYTPGFNDDTWAYDSGIIGYGYGFEEIKVDSPINSMYLRFHFDVANKDSLKALSFLMDYDDGFIAFLNGKEIARINIDKETTIPAHNDLASRSHEFEYASPYNYPVPCIYLDSLVVDSCIVEGANVMAIQVLNDSIDGSDLLLYAALFDITNEPIQASTFYWDVLRYRRLLDLDSTNLPIVVINTDEYGIPYSKDMRVTASMGIIDNGTGNFNSHNDPFNGFHGLISIETRGQSSRDFPKRSYRFEIVDELGQDTGFVLLGMPRDDDWILFGPYTDKSQVRNKFIFDLGSKLGHYEPRSKPCELIINGQHQGLYFLTETIKREKDRIDIANLKEDEVSGIDVTGGYILKWDKESSSRQIVFPKEDNIQPEQTQYINSFMHSYDSVFNTNGFTDPVHGFRKFLSDSSLIDYVIMNELGKNADAYVYSTYFYKDRADIDNRIKFGPLWDFDLCFGNTFYQYGNITTGWQFSYPTNNKLKIKRLFEDTVLVHQFQNRWAELRNGVLSIDSLNNSLDEMILNVQSARERNYYIWPIIDHELFGPGYYVNSYEAEIEHIKQWMSSRINWIDENIMTLYYPLKVYSSVPANSVSEAIQISTYPNPFDDILNIEIQSEQGQNLRLEILNLMGQTEYIQQEELVRQNHRITLDGQILSSMHTGIYILRVFVDDVQMESLKIIKN